MRTRLTLAVAVLTLFSVAPGAARATDFNDRTLCGVLVDAVNKMDEMNLRRANRYIQNAFLAFDRGEVAMGHNSLGDLISVGEAGVMAGNVLRSCAAQRTQTIRLAAFAVYTIAAAVGPHPAP